MASRARQAWLSKVEVIYMSTYLFISYNLLVSPGFDSHSGLPHGELLAKGITDRALHKLETRSEQKYNRNRKQG
jgi:hypothetical protein